MIFVDAGVNAYRLLGGGGFYFPFLEPDLIEADPLILDEITGNNKGIDS